jgi:hypothetical protein
VTTQCKRTTPTRTTVQVPPCTPTFSPSWKRSSLTTMEPPTLNPGSPRSIVSAMTLGPVSWMARECLLSRPQAGGSADVEPGAKLPKANKSVQRHSVGCFGIWSSLFVLTSDRRAGPASQGAMTRETLYP